MKKVFLLFFTSIVIFSCKKETVDVHKMVTIKYEIVSGTSVPFVDVTYGVYYTNRSSTGTNEVPWAINGTGTFIKTESFELGGVAAEIYTTHPNSDKWEIMILGSEGDTLAVGLPKYFQSGGYSYYYASAIATPK